MPPNTPAPLRSPGSRRGLIVVGTDTGVGKTTVSRGLLRLAARRGDAFVPAKPTESGVPLGSLPPDASALLNASGQASLSVSDVCPFPLTLPVTPYVAAQAAGLALRLDQLLAACETLAGRGAPLLVETAGGLLSPLTARETNADLAAGLGLPILLVARNALGTINHTALAVAELRRRHLPLRGVILCDTQADGPDAPTNQPCIEALCGPVVLGRLPHLPAGTDDALADALASQPAVVALIEAPQGDPSLPKPT